MGCGPLHEPQSDCTNVATSAAVPLHDRHCQVSSTDSCSPHPIRRYAPPSPLRGEGARESTKTCVNPGGGKAASNADLVAVVAEELQALAIETETADGLREQIAAAMG